MRLIDADMLIKKLKELSTIEWNKKAAPASWADAYDSLIDVLEEAPTAPKSLRPKGRWIEHYDEKRDIWYFDCPFCEDGYATGTKHLQNFCPNCGADMREDKT